MDNGDRKLLWWRLPVPPDQSVEVGRSMLKTVTIWFAAVVAVVAILAVVLSWL